MTTETRTQDKEAALLDMLDRGQTMVHLDARAVGVDVPSQFQDDAHLRLNFSYRFNLDTFVIDEKGITANLAFGGIDHLCVIPWSAVFAMTHTETGESRVWTMDIPAELLQEVEQAIKSSDLVPEPTIRSVQDRANETEPKHEPTERRVGHLRVIK
jgi:stringent starvation protein B